MPCSPPLRRRPPPPRLAAPLALLLAGALAVPGAARAQGVPPVNGPVCVSGCPEDRPPSGSGESSSGGGGVLFGLFDRIGKARDAALAKRRAQAHEQNEQGVAEFKRRNYAEALRLFRLAEENDRQDAVIRDNVKNAEAALAALRKEQQQQEQLRREQEQYRQQARKLAALMPPVRVAAPSGGARALGSEVPPLGFPSDKWRAYLEAREVVDVLYGKLNQGGALTDEEGQVFYQALQRRNALWAEAQGLPLGDADREALRVSVPARVSPALSHGLPQDGAAPPESPDRRGGGAATQADALTHAFVAEHLSDQQLKVGDRAVKDWLGEAHGEQLAGRAERLWGVGRVLLKARKGGPEGGAELVDFAISRAPQPLSLRAELAKEGGRIYSNVAFQALDRFMVDAMNATGATFDPVAFRKRVKEQMTLGQKGVSAWSTGE